MNRSGQTMAVKELMPFFFEGLIFTDERGMIQMLNQPVLDLIPGATLSQMTGQPVFSYLHSPKIRQFFTHRIDMRNISLSIGTSQVLANFHFLNDKKAVLVLRNVSNLNRLNTELKSAHQQLRVIQAMLNQLEDGVCFINIEGKIVFYNKKQGEIDSREVSDVEGRNYAEAFPEADRHSDTLLHALAYDKEVSLSETFFSSNGKKFSILRKSAPLFLGSQKVGAVSVTRDYSEYEDFVHAFYMHPPDEDAHHGQKGNEPELPAEFLCYSKSMEKLLEDLRQLKDHSANILLYGEHGTGKNTLARYITKMFGREPVYYVNCAVISSHTLEDHLFGREEQAGMLERADGGTIILDKLTGMPLAAQAKLLNVLTRKQIIRKGETEVRAIHVQIIALMNEKPLQAIRQQKLDENLFYELGSISFHLPPLIERREAIPLIADHFLTEKGKLIDSKKRRFSDETAALLHSYHYPGNVRQLGHIIESAINRFPGETVVRPEHLPEYISGHHHAQTDQPFPLAATGSSLVDAVEQFEKQMILTTLDHCSHHLTQTAEQLGISRQSLNYKIRKYGILVEK